MKNKMFKDNIKLVYKVFHEKIDGRFVNQSMKEDLIQIGMFTLWKCCLKFNPDLGVQFSTYAYRAIQKSMMCASIRENKRASILVSLNKPIQDDSEECALTFEEVLAASVDIGAEIEIDNMVEGISAGINERAQKVISLMRKGYSQIDIAKELHITRSEVGKIVKKFRQSLKNTLLFED